ncbi:uncharacterized protein LAESUDRAFT_813750 [Laetiporus sulphureus 93-53]|uniref:Uncharacterized protein n=1 Tax=Laetiporus sulphureus 93-53 TaxID=1314785 RepID=A0A165DLQ3_9APHY|nr:uncharacterized protein LAESUDRAFT_813750 [Laetiporus sulphureus 93-53]KZT05158.1 hypothetical protein LAESUDRAFT_813750 [Laetiporus sulphureus 93-53]
MHRVPSQREIERLAVLQDPTHFNAASGHRHRDKYSATRPELNAVEAPAQDPPPALDNDDPPLAAPRWVAGRVAPPAYPDGRHSHLRNTIQTYENNPELADDMLKMLNDFVSNITKYENPNTRAARERTLSVWALIVGFLSKNNDPERLWHYTVVEQHAPAFLTFRVLYTCGRQGKLIKADTLRTWFNLLSYCIAKYTVDDDRKPHGTTTLVKNGLYAKLDAVVTKLILDHKLDRFPGERVHFGRPELRLVTEYAMMNVRVRFVRIQSTVIFQTSFYTTVRPSTLGVGNKEMEDMERFMKIEYSNLRIFRQGYGKFSVKMRFTNHKGSNADVGKELEYFFQPVMNWFNVCFDLPTWLVTMLFLRGAFKYDTLEELHEGNEAELQFCDKVIGQPLFIRFEAGGRIASGALRPITAHAISAALADLCQGAGLPRAGLYAFRRDAGNDYGMKLNTEMASMMLGHKDSNNAIYRKHYSRNTANIPIVHLRLNEFITDKQTMAMASHAMHQFHSPAVMCLVARKALDENVTDDGEADAGVKPSALDKQSLTEEEKATAEAHPHVVQAKHDFDLAWQGLLALYPPEAQSYKDHLVVHRERFKKIKQHFSLVNGKTEADLEYAESCFSQTLKRYQLLAKKHRRAFADARNKTKNLQTTLRQSGKDTADARYEAIADLEKPSSMIDDLQQFAQQNDEAAYSSNVITADASASSSRIAMASERAFVSTVPLAIPSSASQVSPFSDNVTSNFPHDLSNEDDVEELTHHVNEQLDLGKLLHFPMNAGTSESIATRQAYQKQTVDLHFESLEQALPQDKAFDADENPQPTADTQDINVDELRIQLSVFLAAPVLRERSIVECWKRDKTCIQCKPFIHDPARVNRQFSNISKLNRHINEAHTLWYDLDLHMQIPNSKRLKCPSKNCHYKASTVNDVRKHCLSTACPDQDYFTELKEKHDMTPSRIQRRTVSRNYRAAHKSKKRTTDSDSENDTNQNYIPVRKSKKRATDTVAPPLELASPSILAQTLSAAAETTVPEDLVNVYHVLAMCDPQTLLDHARSNGHLLDTDEDELLVQLEMLITNIRALIRAGHIAPLPQPDTSS